MTSRVDVILLMTIGVRAAIEDYNRHRSDRKQSSKTYLVRRGAAFIETQSADIRVGDVVKVFSVVIVVVVVSLT